MATSVFSASASSSERRLPICLLSSGTVNSAIYSARSSDVDELSSRGGIKRQPTKATNVMPAIAAMPPTGAKSNILNGAPRLSSRMAAMMILGGVPINVTMPPRIVAKLRGIRDRPGLRPALRAV